MSCSPTNNEGVGNYLVKLISFQPKVTVFGQKFQKWAHKNSSGRQTFKICWILFCNLNWLGDG